MLVLNPGFTEAVTSKPTLGWLKTSFLDGWKAYPRNPQVEIVTIGDARALMLDDQPAATDRAIAAFVDRARGTVGERN
jgi:hypothetical protein